MHRTHRWLDRCFDFHNSTPFSYNYEQTLFPIVQGSVYDDLRQQSATYVAQKNAPANAIGGLSVGEPAEEMYAMTDVVCRILPKDKPRYLMGVGTPANLLENIALGVDMFDCVLPTRNGRNECYLPRKEPLTSKIKSGRKTFLHLILMAKVLLIRNTPKPMYVICLLLMKC